MGATISNFFARLFFKKDVKVVMVGLFGAGKTTILYKLKMGETLIGTIPTIGFNVETLIHKNISLTIWDVGAGGDKMRPLWCHHYKDSSAAILVIDSTDQEYLDESQSILDELLHSDELKDAIILILANKQDLPGAMTIEELTNRLKLNKCCNRRWHIHPTSAVEGVGLWEALNWLTTELKNEKIVV